MRLMLGLLVFPACIDAPAADPPLAPARAALHAVTLDLVLDATLEPRSGDVIDCQGGSIRPRTRAQANRGISVPDTLIFLGPGVRGVQIRDCTLEATFPIVAVGGGSHVIAGNVIDASGRGVWIFGSSKNQIERNSLRSPMINIQVNGDTRGTEISGNDIRFAPGRAAADGNPGWAYPSEPWGVGVLTYVYPGLNNIIVNRRIYQDLTFYGTQVHGTEVVGNTIDLEGGGAFGITFAARSNAPYAAQNRVQGGELGLGVAGNPDVSWYYEPGRCSGDPTLRCAEDRTYFEDPTVGCALPGFEDRGTCEGGRWVQGGGRVIAPTFVDNTVTGAETGILTAFCEDLRIEANDLELGSIGLVLAAYSLHQGSTVVGNRTAGFDVGLSLQADREFGFAVDGLQVSYNDFGDNARAFEAFLGEGDEDEEGFVKSAFPFAASLPDNFWGDEPCGFPSSPESWPNVEGPSAAARPIAMAWRAGDARDVARCALEPGRDP
jgi:hypothetical protein